MVISADCKTNLLQTVGQLLRIGQSALNQVCSQYAEVGIAAVIGTLITEKALAPGFVPGLIAVCVMYAVLGVLIRKAKRGVVK